MIGLATGRANAISLALSRVQKLTTNDTYFDPVEKTR